MPKQPSVFQPDVEYRHFLKEIKDQVHQARVQTAHSISRQIISLYLQIGEGIAERQTHLGWGKSVSEQLSQDLRKNFTGEEGFSARNLWRMRQRYLEYKDYPNLTPLVSEIIQLCIVFSPNKLPSIYV